MDHPSLDAIRIHLNPDDPTLTAAVTRAASGAEQTARDGAQEGVPDKGARHRRKDAQE